jgi:methylmalonyl-CoA/ethylmalonyl-CoA epimerase
MRELAGVVTTIDHVGIAVPDLDAAIQWYADTLGLVATHVEVNEQQGVREAMLHAPDDESGPAVQLLAPMTEQSTIA